MSRRMIGSASRYCTTSISLGHWLVCVAVASSVLWLEEARKFIVRRHEATAQAKEA